MRRKSEEMSRSMHGTTASSKKLGVSGIHEQLLSAKNTALYEQFVI
jgi:hypothetical protein